MAGGPEKIAGVIVLASSSESITTRSRIAWPDVSDYINISQSLSMKVSARSVASTLYTHAAPERWEY
jgi:hypothetical protein